MGPLEICLYEAKVEIFDDRYPLDVNPVGETTRLDFVPIPDSETWWAEYHCRTVVLGGMMPSYLVCVPEGELFEVEYPATRASEDADDPPPRHRTFLRTPDLKAADGVVILCCVQYQQHGFRLVPFAGCKEVELLPDPLAKPVPSKPRPMPPAPDPVPIQARREGPGVTYSGRNAQASLFGDDDPKPALVGGRLPDGTLPGQMTFLD